MIDETYQIHESPLEVLTRTRDTINNRIKDALKSCRGLGANTTTLTSLQYDVEETLNSAVQCIPDVSFEERELQHLPTDTVDTLKRKNAFFFQLVQNNHKKLRDYEQTYDLIMGKLQQKNAVIDYIQTTLYKEVCQMREQLFAKDTTGTFEKNIFSLFDFVKLADESDTVNSNLMDKLREEMGQQREQIENYYQRLLGDKEEEYTGIKEELESIRMEYENFRSKAEEEMRLLNDQADYAAAQGGGGTSDGASLKSMKQQYEDRLSHLEEEMNILAKAVKDRTVALEKSRKDFVELRMDHDLTKQRKEDVQADFDKYKRDAEEKSRLKHLAQQKTLEGMKQQYDKDVGALHKSLTETTKELKAEQQMREELAHRVKDLDIKLKERTDQYYAADQDLARIKDENVNMQYDLQNAEAKLGSLSDKITDLDTENKALQHELSKYEGLNGLNEKYVKTLEEAKLSLAAKLAAAKADLEEHEALLDAMRKSLKDSDAELKKLHDEYEEKRNRVARLENELNDKSKVYQDLLYQSAQSQHQNNNTAKELGEKTKSLEQYQSEAQTKDLKILQLEEKLQKIQDKLYDLVLRNADLEGSSTAGHPMQRVSSHTQTDPIKINDLVLPKPKEEEAPTEAKKKPKNKPSPSSTRDEGHKVKKPLTPPKALSGALQTTLMESDLDEAKEEKNPMAQFLELRKQRKHQAAQEKDRKFMEAMGDENTGQAGWLKGKTFGLGENGLTGTIIDDTPAVVGTHTSKLRSPTASTQKQREAKMRTQWNRDVFAKKYQNMEDGGVAAESPQPSNYSEAPPRVDKRAALSRPTSAALQAFLSTHPDLDTTEKQKIKNAVSKYADVFSGGGCKTGYRLDLTNGAAAETRDREAAAASVAQKERERKEAMERHDYMFKASRKARAARDSAQVKHILEQQQVHNRPSNKFSAEEFLHHEAPIPNMAMPVTATPVPKRDSKWSKVAAHLDHSTAVGNIKLGTTPTAAAASPFTYDPLDKKQSTASSISSVESGSIASGGGPISPWVVSDGDIKTLTNKPLPVLTSPPLGAMVLGVKSDGALIVAIPKGGGAPEDTEQSVDNDDNIDTQWKISRVKKQLEQVQQRSMEASGLSSQLNSKISSVMDTIHKVTMSCISGDNNIRLQDLTDINNAHKDIANLVKKLHAHVDDVSNSSKVVQEITTQSEITEAIVRYSNKSTSRPTSSAGSKVTAAVTGGGPPSQTGDSSKQFDRLESGGTPRDTHSTHDALLQQQVVEAPAAGTISTQLLAAAQVAILSGQLELPNKDGIAVASIIHQHLQKTGSQAVDQALSTNDDTITNVQTTTPYAEARNEKAEGEGGTAAARTAMCGSANSSNGSTGNPDQTAGGGGRSREQQKQKEDQSKQQPDTTGTGGAGGVGAGGGLSAEQLAQLKAMVLSITAADGSAVTTMTNVSSVSTKHPIVPKLHLVGIDELRKYAEELFPTTATTTTTCRTMETHTTGSSRASTPTHPHGGDAPPQPPTTITTTASNSSTTIMHDDNTKGGINGNHAEQQPTTSNNNAIFKTQLKFSTEQIASMKVAIQSLMHPTTQQQQPTQQHNTKDPVAVSQGRSSKVQSTKASGMTTTSQRHNSVMSGVSTGSGSTTATTTTATTSSKKQLNNRHSKNVIAPQNNPIMQRLSRLINKDVVTTNMFTYAEVRPVQETAHAHASRQLQQAAHLSGALAGDVAAATLQLIADLGPDTTAELVESGVISLPTPAALLQAEDTLQNRKRKAFGQTLNLQCQKCPCRVECPCTCHIDIAHAKKGMLTYGQNGTQWSSSQPFLTSMTSNQFNRPSSADAEEFHRRARLAAGQTGPLPNKYMEGNFPPTANHNYRFFAPSAPLSSDGASPYILDNQIEIDFSHLEDVQEATDSHSTPYNHPMSKLVSVNKATEVQVQHWINNGQLPAHVDKTNIRIFSYYSGQNYVQFAKHEPAALPDCVVAAHKAQPDNLISMPSLPPYYSTADYHSEASSDITLADMEQYQQQQQQATTTMIRQKQSQQSHMYQPDLRSSSYYSNKGHTPHSHVHTITIPTQRQSPTVDDDVATVDTIRTGTSTEPEILPFPPKPEDMAAAIHVPSQLYMVRPCIGEEPQERLPDIETLKEQSKESNVQGLTMQYPPGSKDDIEEQNLLQKKMTAALSASQQEVATQAAAVMQAEATDLAQRPPSTAPEETLAMLEHLRSAKAAENAHVIKSKTAKKQPKGAQYRLNQSQPVNTLINTTATGGMPPKAVKNSKTIGSQSATTTLHTFPMSNAADTVQQNATKLPAMSTEKEPAAHNVKRPSSQQSHRPGSVRLPSAQKRSRSATHCFSLV